MPDQDIKTENDFANCLRNILKGKVCVVGIGNRLRGDDGAGPRLIDARNPSAPGIWLDVGTAPENYLEPIAQHKPDTVLLVDAVSFNAAPGTCCLMDASALDAAVISTHASSLSMLADYLTARIATRVCVLAIQPEKIDDQKGLSKSVEDTVRQLSSMLFAILAFGRDDNNQKDGPKTLER